MLAQNFKTAADLGITEDQHRALVLAMGALERDEIRHVAFPNDKPAEVQGVVFNMDHWSDSYACGSVCCIGGTAELLGGLKRWELDCAADNNDRLHDLFYPSPDGRRSTTTEQAAIATRSYLTTGKANWKLALASTEGQKS